MYFWYLQQRYRLFDVFSLVIGLRPFHIHAESKPKTDSVSVVFSRMTPNSYRIHKIIDARCISFPIYLTSMRLLEALRYENPIWDYVK